MAPSPRELWLGEETHKCSCYCIINTVRMKHIGGHWWFSNNFLHFTNSLNELGPWFKVYSHLCFYYSWPVPPTYAGFLPEFRGCICYRIGCFSLLLEWSMKTWSDITAMLVGKTDRHAVLCHWSWGELFTVCLFSLHIPDMALSPMASTVLTLHSVTNDIYRAFLHTLTLPEEHS